MLNVFTVVAVVVQDNKKNENKKHLSVFDRELALVVLLYFCLLDRRACDFQNLAGTSVLVEGA